MIFSSTPRTPTITFRIDSSDNYSLSPFYVDQLVKIYEPLSLDPSANVIEIDSEGCRQTADRQAEPWLVWG